MSTDKKLTVKQANFRWLDIPKFNNGRPDAVHVAQSLWTYVAKEMSRKKDVWGPDVVIVCDNDVEYGKAALYANGTKLDEVDILVRCRHCESDGSTSVWLDDCYTDMKRAEQKVLELEQALALKIAEYERLKNQNIFVGYQAGTCPVSPQSEQLITEAISLEQIDDFEAAFKPLLPALKKHGFTIDLTGLQKLRELTTELERERISPLKTS